MPMIYQNKIKIGRWLVLDIIQKTLYSNAIQRGALFLPSLTIISVNGAIWETVAYTYLGFYEGEGQIFADH